MRTDSVFSASALQAHVAMILVSGLSLALSIQPPTQISALRVAAMTYSPMIFPLVTTLIFGLFAVSRGALLASEAGDRIARARLLLRAIQQISFGLVVLVPFYVFSRALLPTGTWGVVALLGYSFLFGLFVCVASFHLERHRVRKRRSAFLLRYAVYLALCVIPFALGTISESVSLLLTVSPIGFAIEVVQGISVAQAVSGCVVPFLGLMGVLMRLQRADRRHHAF